jgi:hypothetical protein
VNDPATNEAKSVRVPVNLGPKSKITKTEARQALEREITNNWASLVLRRASSMMVPPPWDGSSTIGSFLSKKLLIQLDIVEPLGEIPLANFDKFSLQLHLNKLAITRSKDRVLQMRAYIRDIFAQAVDQDFLVKDPAGKLKVPAQLRATDTTTLTWDQLRLALSKLSLRNRILLELDMTNALHPS